VRHVVSVLALGALFALGVLATASASPRALPRSTVDRPDEVAGPQIHVVYALPSDGADRHLDDGGVLAGTVASWNGWLRNQTGGRGLRVDTSTGEPDVTFVRLGLTDGQMAAKGAYVRDEIEVELHAAGFNAPDKIYAVYYDGTSTYSCGGGAWPPALPGNVAALYLHGLPDGPVRCDSNSFAGAGQAPGYLDFAMLHEIMHTLGFVPTCAPHQTRAGHASDSPTDLMWAGDAPWNPTTLDVGRDDYYGAHIPGCIDFADSAYLEGNTVPTTASTTTSTTTTTTITTTKTTTTKAKPKPKAKKTPPFCKRGQKSRPRKPCRKRR
jgi:hypothetical protein